MNRKKIKLLPGTPNDENREYLPEAIRNSDMIVNENGNSSQVYPARLIEYKDIVADGVEDVWYEYVPESYKPDKKTPLVLAMHGGLMTGWGQAIYTSWTMVADREGFIVVFPNAHKRRIWMVEIDRQTLDIIGKPNESGFYMHIPPEKPEENHDMNCALGLIERMKAKYNIDEGRIFMQGMSMGNMMTGQFARYYGNLLSGKAGSGGPASPPILFDESGKPVNRAGALAVWQSRLELDAVPPFSGIPTETYVVKNREYWKIINGCETLPEIKIAGEDNFAFYKGTKADFVFRDVKNRDHGQTLDDAELVWDYLFSGVYRDAEGNIVNTTPNCPRKCDAYAIALAAGSDRAYVNNGLVAMPGPVFLHRKLKYHGLNGDAIVRGEYYMAPVSFVAEVLGQSIETSDGGYTAELTLKDGRVLQFARGSIGCVVDGYVHSMLCEAVYRNGELYVPIQWICQRLLNNHASVCEGVLYITDHWCELSLNMAHILRDEVLV